MAKMLPVALLGAMTVALVGCAARPSEEELTESILSATAAEADIDLSEEAAACIARQLLDSGLSDTTLDGLAEDFDAPEVLKTEVDEVEQRVAEATTTCQQQG